MQQQRRPGSLLSLLLVIVALTLAATVAGALRHEDDDDDRGVGSRPLQSHHHRQSQHGRHRAASWQVASHWCRTASGDHDDTAGLPTLPTTGDSTVAAAAAAFDTAAEKLARRAASWPVDCYWLGNAHDDARLSRLVENRPRGRRISNSRRQCLCVRGGGSRSDRSDRQLRLHLVSCRMRLPFHCAKPTVAEAATTATTTRTPGTKTAVGAAIVEIAKAATTKAPSAAATRTTASYDDALDEVPADPDTDEAVDHGKFPEFELQPDGHPKGWLPPWTALTTTAAAAAAALPTKTAAASKSSTSNSSSIMSSGSSGNETTTEGGGVLHMLMTDQRSEFITLLVLYTIVGTICLVLLGLCLVRCCRGYCGHAKVRYVRQVDADDIPRFMPSSSWA